MCDREKCLECEKENVGVFKTVGMLVVFFCFIAGVAAGAVLVLKKVKKAVLQINKETEYEPLDGEDLTKTDIGEGNDLPEDGD